MAWQFFLMRFVKESFIRATPERVFGFHEQPNALKLLTPPWEKAQVIQTASISQVGAQAIVEARILGPLKTRWVAEHTEYNPPFSFEDVQRKGPFRSWRHRHVIGPHKLGAFLRDEITFELPFGRIGFWLASSFVNKRLRNLFDYRHEITRRWCEGEEDSFK